jgi:hypothetical protein
MTTQYQSVDFNDLITKGYVIIKSFLNIEEVEFLANDYQKKQENINKNYMYFDMSTDAKMLVEKKALVISKEVNNQCGISANMMTPAAIYLSNQAKCFPWHQDHEPWYTFQQLNQYLNFSVPIIKPDSKLSGLSILPFDIIEKELPDYLNNLKHSGAKRFLDLGSTTQVYDDNNGTDFILPIGIDSICISPELNLGDLLLLRGDVPHKTQDSLTGRVAANWRLTNRDKLINKTLMFSGCERKLEYIRKNPIAYNAVLTAFEKAKKEELTAPELFSLIFGA